MARRRNCTHFSRACAGLLLLLALVLLLTALAVVQRHFWKFAFYVLALGLVVLVLLWLAPGAVVTPAGPAG